MGRLNAAWLDGNPMPNEATLEARVKWHLAHAEKCGCRAIPETVPRELRRRGRPRRR